MVLPSGVPYLIATLDSPPGGIQEVVQSIVPGNLIGQAKVRIGTTGIGQDVQLGIA